MSPAPACPIRDGEPCTLCVPGADGPQDCGLVWLVMSDPDLREDWLRRRAAQRAASGPGAVGGPDSASSAS